MRMIKITQRNKTAFTLVELLIATAIMGTISLAILATLGGGLRIYEHIQTYGENQADVLLAFEGMEKDLRNTVNLSMIYFTGDSGKIAFAGRVAVRDLEGNPVTSLGRILYYRDEDTGTLMREEQDYPSAVSQEGEDTGITESLALVTDINFMYSFFDEKNKRYEWTRSWSGEDGLPAGVKIEIVFSGDQNVTLVRTVLIPAAG